MLAGVVVLVVAVAIGSARAAGSEQRVVTTSTPVASAAPSAVLVQVSGAVRRPGVISLPSGARALDAVAAAGGLTASADAAAVNLAARVVDGEQLVVPTKAAAGPQSSPAATGAPVSLNSATEQQLESLPRVGPAMAARIIAWRTAHGGFSSVEDLKKVSGIGDKTYADLAPLVQP